jgi:hypothetical protein
VEILDSVEHGWRETHVLVLDNMSGHGSEQTRYAIEALRVPTLFTAPASYNVLGVEAIFGVLKRKSRNQLLENEEMHELFTQVSRPTFKQKIIYDVTRDIFAMSAETKRSIFRRKIK